MCASTKKTGVLQTQSWLRWRVSHQNIGFQTLTFTVRQIVRQAIGLRQGMQPKDTRIDRLALFGHFPQQIQHVIYGVVDRRGRLAFGYPDGLVGLEIHQAKLRWLCDRSSDKLPFPEAAQFAQVMQGQLTPPFRRISQRTPVHIIQAGQAQTGR